MCAGAHRSRKKVSNSLKLDLEVAISHLLWLLGTELWFSARVASTTVNHLSNPTKDVFNNRLSSYCGVCMIS